MMQVLDQYETPKLEMFLGCLCQISLRIGPVHLFGNKALNYRIELVGVLPKGEVTAFLFS